MSLLKNRWFLITLILACWAVVASLLCGYYYYQYSTLVARIEGSEASINLGIDYGNGTRIWFNGTRGLTLYDAMLDAGWDVETIPYGAMGLYVKAINGVEESPEDSRYWGWWTWTSLGWAHGGAACDKYVLSPGETILWYYSYVNMTTFEMTPPP